MDRQHFVSVLADWYARHGRDLPWRHTRDPYAIWLSEVILQQTRISQGTVYWHRFMAAYPTVDALAAASEDDVLKLWQGLGYYSRARNLHTAAKQIVALGHFPNTLADIRKLKGVGDYTAAAIASFVFGIRAAAVDGNAYRVLARVFGIQTAINSTEGKKEFSLLAEECVGQHIAEAATSAATSTPFDNTAALFNQAIMDFGATQCTPKSPLCAVCPLVEECIALREGTIDQLPVKLKTTKVKTVHLTYIYLRVAGYTAIRRRPAGSIWQGLWEPMTQMPDGASITLLRQGVRHVLTHRILLADFYLATMDQRPPLPEGYQWVKEEELGNYAVPRLIEKLWAEVGTVNISRQVKLADR